MCDDSLGSFQGRFAEEGEELVLYECKVGALGFVTRSSLLAREMLAKREGDSFWAAVIAWLLPWRSAAPISPIGIAPGTRLLLTGVPRSVQGSLCIGASEVVVFTELSSRRYLYRDALLLPNGTRVLLQDFPEGIHAVVLALPEHSKEVMAGKVHAA